MRAPSIDRIHRHCGAFRSSPCQMPTAKRGWNELRRSAGLRTHMCEMRRSSETSRSTARKSGFASLSKTASRSSWRLRSARYGSDAVGELVAGRRSQGDVRHRAEPRQGKRGKSAHRVKTIARTLLTIMVVAARPTPSFKGSATDNGSPRTQGG
jgi:hypothetical protein